MKLGRYLVGLISGLTFGMLFAPKRGKNLRNDLIKKGGQSGYDSLMVLFNAFRDAGADAVSEMKKLSESEQLQSALSMSKDKMREYLSDLEESGYDVAARAQGKIDEFSDMAVTAGTKIKRRVASKKKAVKRSVKSRVKSVKKAATKKLRAKKTTVKNKAIGGKE